jgi:hypothetical protein
MCVLTKSFCYVSSGGPINFSLSDGWWCRRSQRWVRWWLFQEWWWKLTVRISWRWLWWQHHSCWYTSVKCSSSFRAWVGGAMENSPLPNFEAHTNMVSYSLLQPRDTYMFVRASNLFWYLKIAGNCCIFKIAIEEHPSKLRPAIKSCSSHIFVRANLRS